MTTPLDIGAAANSPADRYSAIVYATALRQTRDPHLAADITQAVFLILLRKSQSGKAPEEQRMVGWLLKVTRFVVRETRRASWRRRRREFAAAPVAASAPDASPEIIDTLDTALLSLGAADRELIARRYLHEESVESLAAALGLSPNTASKRLGRALEKLRSSLLHRGINATMATLTATLLATAAVKPPAAAAATTSPVAHALARRVLWHALVFNTAAIAGIAAACCILTTLTVFLVFPANAPSEAAAPAPPVPATASRPADERLIHLGKVLEPSSDRLVAQVLDGIEQNRPKLKTLEIESTCTFVQKRDDDGTMAPTQIIGKGWFQTGTPQQFRVEISLERGLWMDGPKPYLDDSYTETWDGSTLQILHQPPHSIVRAEVGQREGYAQGTAIFGRNYSMQLPQRIGFGAGDSEVNENPLDVLILKSMRLAGYRVVMNGRESLELECRYRSLNPSVQVQVQHYVRRYWFDPRRGFALLACQEGLDNAPRMDELVVDELGEPAPGVYYPVHGRSVIYSRDRGTITWHVMLRSEFQATRLVANQPLSPSLFHLDFPPGVGISHRGPSASSQPASQPATQR